MEGWKGDQDFTRIRGKGGRMEEGGSANENGDSTSGAKGILNQDLQD